jgi:hypothetical protein
MLQLDLALIIGIIYGIKLFPNSRRSIGHTESEDSKDDVFNRHGRLESSFREVSLRYMAGTIEKDEVQRFKRLLFRASRGNKLISLNFFLGKILSYFEEMETLLKDFQGREISKVVYVLVFEEGNHFKEKVQKICDSF